MISDVFKPHGYFDITTESDVLIVDSIGPFNIELVVEYRQSLEHKIASFASKSWRQIIILHEDSLFTPDALEELMKVVEYRMSKGLIYSAVVLGDSAAKHLIEHQLASIYNKVGLAHSFHQTLSDAKQTLLIK